MDKLTRYLKECTAIRSGTRRFCHFILNRNRQHPGKVFVYDSVIVSLRSTENAWGDLTLKYFINFHFLTVGI